MYPKLRSLSVPVLTNPIAYLSCLPIYLARNLPAGATVYVLALVIDYTGRKILRVSKLFLLARCAATGSTWVVVGTGD